MTVKIGRREFVGAGAALLAALGNPLRAANLSQFKLGVITDEVTQDFEQALIWAKGFGLNWVELRFVWGKYVTEFTNEDVERAKDLLEKYNLRVSVVDSPYFKTLLPGTTSKFNDPKNDPLQSDFAKQDAVLERAIARAKDFGTDKVRIFAFLRVPDPNTVFDRVAKELDRTAATAQREGIRLVLENEFSCNVATGVESAAILKVVKSPAIGLNWDPGNAFAAGEKKPYPDGYAPLDKERIWHMHLKDAQDDPGQAESTWRPIGGGKIDYLGQFRAAWKDGYEGTLSLETHYMNAAKNREASSRESMEGLLKIIREV
ncbi:MAG TPA: sugar phosphate isomerase/epimerase family protein [Candidatus Acidoferrum sp.]|nr:sugar phosphate isomerase/epimerase family protein [Candidatus Acidoferrum sp.]